MLDTHLLAWLAGNRARLRPAERAAIEAHAGDLITSVVAIWELRLKWRSSPHRTEADGLIRPDDALQFAAHSNIKVAPLTAEQVIVPVSPSLLHKDPFDEMLLVHAGQLNAKLLTRDKYLLGHPLVYSL